MPRVNISVHHLVEVKAFIGRVARGDAPVLDVLQLLLIWHFWVVWTREVLSENYFWALISTILPRPVETHAGGGWQLESWFFLLVILLHEFYILNLEGLGRFARHKLLQIENLDIRVVVCMSLFGMAHHF